MGVGAVEPIGSWELIDVHRASVSAHRHRRPRPDRRVDRAGACASAGRRCASSASIARPVLAHAIGGGAIDRAGDGRRGGRPAPIWSSWPRRCEQNVELLREVGARTSRRRPSSPTSAAPSATSSRRRARSATGVTFVGGHPIGGAERGGFGFARRRPLRGPAVDLHAGRRRRRPTPRRRAVRVRARPRRRPSTMAADEHDRLMAFLSHLPQLDRQRADGGRRQRRRRRRAALAGRGLIDTTRLASSPASVWRDICATNADAIGDALDLLIERLTELRADPRARQRHRRHLRRGRALARRADEEARLVGGGPCSFRLKAEATGLLRRGRPSGRPGIPGDRPQIARNSVRPT